MDTAGLAMFMYGVFTTLVAEFALLMIVVWRRMNKK